MAEDPPRAAVTQRAVRAVRDRAPEGVEVVALTAGTDLERVDFLVPDHEPGVREALPGLTRLSAVQLLSAGADGWEGLVPSQATLCSARGARDGPVAEWVLGALLGASTGLLECARRRVWNRDRELSDLAGSDGAGRRAGVDRTPCADPP